MDQTRHWVRNVPSALLGAGGGRRGRGAALLCWLLSSTVAPERVFVPGDPYSCWTLGSFGHVSLPTFYRGHSPVPRIALLPILLEAPGGLGKGRLAWLGRRRWRARATGWLWLDLPRLGRFEGLHCSTPLGGARLLPGHGASVVT